MSFSVRFCYGSNQFLAPPCLEVSWRILLGAQLLYWTAYRSEGLSQNGSHSTYGWFSPLIRGIDFIQGFSPDVVGRPVNPMRRRAFAISEVLRQQTLSMIKPSLLLTGKLDSQHAHHNTEHDGLMARRQYPSLSARVGRLSFGELDSCPYGDIHQRAIFRHRLS